MRQVAASRIEWDEGGKDRLVWKFPEKKIAWNSTLVVQEKQAAGLFTGHELISRHLKMHDVFIEPGEHVLSPNKMPSLVKEFPEVVARSHFSCLVVFCSVKEHTYCPHIHTGDSFGQGWVHAEADGRCKFKITDSNKFMKNVIANHKKTSNDRALGYLDRFLGDELFRQQPPYQWPPKQKIPLEERWKSIGIQLLDLKFEHYKQYGGGVGA